MPTRLTPIVAEAPTDYDPPARLRALPSWQLSAVARRAHDLVSRELTQDGLRRQHFTVLTSLIDQGPASQADLGRRLWIDRSDLHAILAELEAAELVQRTRDPTDRRRNHVAITTAGRSTQRRLAKRIDAAQATLLLPLSDTERAEFLRLLGTLVAAI
jgi:DNA-binding MarR family transcriptional regulator